MKPKLEYIFTARVEFGERLRFGPFKSGGERGFLNVTGGTITGPRLQGTVMPNSGGDWPIIRTDGVVEFDAIYGFQASDGTVIQITNSGLRHAPPEVLHRMNTHQDVDPSEYYFRITPRFEVQSGPHEWLAQTVIVGAADRHKNYSDFYYYAVV
jgi:hypothetical protein